MTPYRVESPATPLVPYSDLRTMLRIDLTGDATEDAAQQLFVEGLEQAAIDYLDGYSGSLGRCILDQKWAFPLDPTTQTVYLPFPSSHTFDIELKDINGDLQPVAGVSITEGENCVYLEDLPSGVTGLYLTLRAGWATVGDVPANLKHAIKMMVAFWFENRSAVATKGPAVVLPLGAQTMLRPLKHLMV